MGRIRYTRDCIVLLGLSLSLAAPAHGQNATPEDVAWAHAALKTTLERAHEPLTGTGEWSEGDTKSVTYSGEGCGATLVETYPAADGTPASEKRIELNWFEQDIYFRESDPFDGRFVLRSSNWSDEQGDELPLFTGEDQIEPRVALNKLYEVCSPFARNDQLNGAISAQSQIDLLLEDTGFPLFADGAQTDRWGTREVVGTGCETWIELHYPEGDERTGSRDWMYLVWNQVAPRIDPQFPDFVIIDIGDDPRFIYAGSAAQAEHLKAAMDDLGAQCRAIYGAADETEAPLEATASPPPARLWPRPEPVAGIGWQTNRNDWSCQLYTDLGQDRFALLHYQKAPGIYYLWLWDGDRIPEGTQPVDDLMVSVRAAGDEVGASDQNSAFFHDTRLIAPLSAYGTSAMNAILSPDNAPTILIRSAAERINARYLLPTLTLADVQDFKACVDPYWNPPEDEVPFDDDVPIDE